MNTQVEVKRKPLDPRDVAFQSHEEAAGLAGLPLIERAHFDPQYKPVAAAEPPGDVIGKPAVVIPET